MRGRRARGDASLGEVATAHSTVGSHFQVALIGDTSVGDRPAVRAEIAGRGWIHGIHRIGLDPTDPYPDGHMVSDRWGDAFDPVDREGRRISLQFGRARCRGLESGGEPEASEPGRQVSLSR